MPICFKCDKNVMTVNVLSVHLCITHKLSKSETHRCSEFGCFGIFSNWDKYRKHLMSYHQYPSKLKIECTSLPSDVNSQYVETQTQDNRDSSYDIVEQLNSKDECTIEQKDMSSLKEFILAYTAKLYASHQLPRNHVQNILDDSRDLVQQMISVTKPTIKDTLFSSGVTDSTITKVEYC